jgi:hypothetical protein
MAIEENVDVAKNDKTGGKHVFAIGDLFDF